MKTFCNTDNPYSSNYNPEPIRCSNPPGVYELLCFVILCIFSIYGLCSFMEDTGIIIWYDGGSHFWFEPFLRDLIHKH